MVNLLQLCPVFVRKAYVRDASPKQLFPRFLNFIYNFSLGLDFLSVSTPFAPC